jgi:trans-2,3-dihydro-3-hydroxyanthranilate isomerase
MLSSRKPDAFTVRPFASTPLAVMPVADAAALAAAAGRAALRLRQGVETGRPSDLAPSVRSDAVSIRAVRLAGTAVRIADGRIRIPDRGG